MPQLVEGSLPTLEDRGSNPVISKKNCIEKDKVEKKRPGLAHLKR